MQDIHIEKYFRDVLDFSTYIAFSPFSYTCTYNIEFK